MNHSLPVLATFMALRSLPRAIAAFCVVIPQLSPTSVVVIPGFSTSIARTASCLYRRSAEPLSTSLTANECSTIDWRKPALPLLQAQHAVIRLLRSSVPPSATATLWSTSSCTLGALCPQYWQVYESRCSTCQRSLYHPANVLLRVIAYLHSVIIHHVKVTGRLALSKPVSPIYIIYRAFSVYQTPLVNV